MQHPRVKKATITYKRIRSERRNTFVNRTKTEIDVPTPATAPLSCTPLFAYSSMRPLSISFHHLHWQSRSHCVAGTIFDHLPLSILSCLQSNTGFGVIITPLV
jgi:hypothetical protein